LSNKGILINEQDKTRLVKGGQGRSDQDVARDSQVGGILIITAIVLMGIQAALVIFSI